MGMVNMLEAHIFIPWCVLLSEICYDKFDIRAYLLSIMMVKMYARIKPYMDGLHSSQHDYVIYRVILNFLVTKKHKKHISLSHIHI